jgi:hypothetical protein
MQLLRDEWLNSPDPGAREAAYREYSTLLGIAPTMSPQTTPIPLRT